MKKIIALSLAGLLMPAVLLAKGKTSGHGNHPMAGCGLAYLLFSSDNNSKPIQILASTTNNIYGTQTFGITSGTSGCTEDGAVKFAKEVELYAEINLKDLSRDMVTGGGDYLNAFAGLLGIQQAKRAEFFQLTQANYSTLFPTAQTSSVEMLETLKGQLEAHPDLLG